MRPFIPTFLVAVALCAATAGVATAQDASDAPVTPASPAATTPHAFGGTVFKRPFELSIPGDGSVQMGELTPNIAFFGPAGVAAGLTLWVVEEVFSDPCDPTSETMPIVDAEALVKHVVAITQLDVADSGEASVDGRVAQVLDLTGLAGSEGCPGPDGAILWPDSSELGTARMNVSGGWNARLVVVDVDGSTFVAEIWARAMDTWVPVAQTIIDSIRFVTPRTAGPATTVPPEGEYTVELSAADLEASGMSANRTGDWSGTYTWTFAADTAELGWSGPAGEATCTADLAVEDDHLMLTYTAGSDCAGEVDLITWTQSGDGLDLTLIGIARATFLDNRAYLEAKPWRQVGE